jgi:hypothetical protein
VTYNARVRTFVAGGDDVRGGGRRRGVYVARGSADGPTVVERMVVLPTGALHDLDGTADAAVDAADVVAGVRVSGGAPGGAHAVQELDLAAAAAWDVDGGGAGAAAGDVVGSVAARLVAVKGTWEAPYRVGEKNELVIRAEWQLKGFL